MKKWLILFFTSSLFSLERERSCPVVHSHPNATQVAPLNSFHVRRVAWGEDNFNTLPSAADDLSFIPHVESEGTDTPTPDTMRRSGSFDSTFVCPVCRQPYNLRPIKILCSAQHRMCRACFEKWRNSSIYDPRHGCPLCRREVQSGESSAFFAVDIAALRQTMGWGGNEVNTPPQLIAQLIARSLNDARQRDGRCERRVCGAVVGMALVALVVFSALTS